jgi:hypothetical protein
VIPGKEVQLGDKTFIIPSLNLGMLRGGLLEKIKASDELVGSGSSGFDVMVQRSDIILAAVRRNYSTDELSDDDFYTRLDLSNFSDAWMATLGFSRAEAVTEDGTSTGSTPLSPVPTDGTTELSTN